MKESIPEFWLNFQRNRYALEPISQREIRSFLSTAGDKPAGDYYLRHWNKMLNNQSKITGFNWPAFLFGMLWFVYRRMYFYGLLWLLLEQFILPLLTAKILLAIIPDVDPQLIVILWIKAILILRVVLGFLANRVYLNKALRVIDRHRKAAVDDQERLIGIYRQGGSSSLAVFIALILLFLIRFYSRLL